MKATSGAPREGRNTDEEEIRAHGFERFIRGHVENTHMASSGTPWDADALDAIAALGRPLHLDGARLFNAEVATGVSAARYASAATTVMCCLSKGLGAPETLGRCVSGAFSRA